MYLAGLNEDPVEGLQDGDDKNDQTQSEIDNEMLTNIEATEAARKNDASGSQSREITAKAKRRRSEVFLFFLGIVGWWFERRSV